MVCSLKDFSFRFGQLIWPLALLIMGGLASQASAENPGFENLLGSKLGSHSSAKADFSATLTPATAKPGEEVTLTVTAKLPPHSYIYATTGDFEQRTKITVKTVVGLEAVDADFQPDRPPEVKLDPVLNQQLSKFHGDVAWSKKYRIEQGADVSKVAVDLELEGQYCSEGPGGQCTLIKPAEKRHAALVDLKANAAADEEPAVRFRYNDKPIQGKTNPAEFRYQLAPTKSSGGKKVKLAITMLLDEGWHTFPTTFKGEGGSPTDISFTNTYGLKPLGDGLKPNREVEIKNEEDGLRLEIYHKEVTWTQEFEVLPDARPNAFGLEGKIKYQVCKSSCVPKSAKFSIGVTGPEVTPPQSVDFFDEPEAAQIQKTRPQDKGLVAFLLTAIVAAMVALLTPCVFPMLPITVSFFLKQSEKKGGRPIVLAFVFSISIIVAFVVIGVGIAAIFGATKPNELANNWILNLFLASIFFAFALNMLGLFEIQIPSWLLTLTATGEQTGGYFGVVFMALTFVLTSFSCTFAFVGSLLAAAAQGEYYWPVLGMVAFGGTFAAPFFFLALAPGVLKTLPKSGGWLNSVKVVMGFVEVGVAIKYISIVDQQFNSVPWLFDFTNVMTLWSVLSICTGLYLLGQFRMSHDSPVQGLSPIRVLLAVGFLMLGGLFAVGLTQPQREAWFVDQLVAFAPARLDNEDFELDFDKAVIAATASNRPMFVDFTGVFCTNCRLMEKRMAKPNNRRRLERFIQVQLYTDKVPKINDEAEQARILARNVSLQVDWFGDVTLPSYAVVTPDGKTILSTFFGLEQREGDFAQFLDEGAMKWQALKTAN